VAVVVPVEVVGAASRDRSEALDLSLRSAVLEVKPECHPRPGEPIGQCLDPSRHDADRVEGAGAGGGDDPGVVAGVVAEVVGGDDQGRGHSSSRLKPPLTSAD
jgi:hypothetical protein